MFCELLFVLVSFTALVALERLLPCVRLHVVLQVTRRGARVVALVTLELFLLLYADSSCELSKH